MTNGMVSINVKWNFTILCLLLLPFKREIFYTQGYLSGDVRMTVSRLKCNATAKFWNQEKKSCYPLNITPLYFRKNYLLLLQKLMVWLESYHVSISHHFF